MSKTSKIIIATLLVAVLLLGIGYAAIQNVTLNIAGTAAADPNQENFKVMFTGIPKVSDEEHVTASITDDINATINVSGLTKKGEIVSATYIVQNASTDLSADLSVATTNSNTEYFTISSELAKTSLIAGEATTVTVTVEVTKTPLAESVSSTIGVQLIATPVQPGEEGTTNDYPQTPEPTLASVTNANIGDYIDLGNNIIGTESTADDWRILYKDGETIYAILADYLPAEQVPVSAGLEVGKDRYGAGGQYSVRSDTDRDTLINGLKNTTAWSNFTNGIVGATATGSPTAELLMSSYNTKNGTELIYTYCPWLDREVKDYNLYGPHIEGVDGCYGYWLASPYANNSSGVWNVSGTGKFSVGDCSTNERGVRPVVSLPSSTVAELVDGVWNVKYHDAPEPTLASVTNANIGDYIDLGNNIIGTESTADDWRILYKDGNTVYAILADYLPAEQVPVSIGINTDPTTYPYSVWSDGDTLVDGLKNEAAWSNFANGISGAIATGSPTAELLMSSYNTKNGTKLVYTDWPRLDSGTEDYDLYVPHTKRVSECNGCWLASGDVYYVDFSGEVYTNSYCFPDYGVRPVVSLPSSTVAELVDGVWNVKYHDTQEPTLEPEKPEFGTITNDNIGDYIDLGNNIIGTESTTDDWKILYKDGETIYAILADYLPAEQIPASAGLDTNTTDRPYSVWSDTDRDTLLNGLLNTTAWSSFTNGIEGALATGSPTAELLMSSYNTKNGTELVYTDYPILDSWAEEYDLYVPHPDTSDECYGYWLASPLEVFSPCMVCDKRRLCLRRILLVPWPCGASCSFSTI